MIISGNKSQIKQSYSSNPIKLDRKTDYEIALIQCTQCVTHGKILVINFKNNIFEYRKKNKDEWVNIVIPNELYDEKDLNYFLTCYFNSFLDRCPNNILSNLATTTFVIILKEN